jgi:hypothetical protein
MSLHHGCLAGKVGCRHVETGVKTTDMCFFGATCHRHVGRHVGNTTQQAVGKGTTIVGPTCHLLTCWPPCRRDVDRHVFVMPICC